VTSDEELSVSGRMGVKGEQEMQDEARVSDIILQWFVNRDVIEKHGLRKSNLGNQSKDAWVGAKSLRIYSMPS